MIVYRDPHRRQWWGYTDMGPIQIPPNPQYMVLTDRTTGTQYWVTWAESVTNPSPNGFGYVAINTALPGNQINTPPTGGPTPTPPQNYNNCQFFDAFDEPVIGYLDGPNGMIISARLIIDNGYLGVDVEQLSKQGGRGLTAAPLTLIQKLLAYTREYVTIILSVTDPGWYAWVPTTLTQTPNPPPYNGMVNANYPAGY